MTYNEIDQAMREGKIVYFQSEDNTVIDNTGYAFEFPYGPYAVKYIDGSLAYMTTSEAGDFPEFFMEEEE